jgi:UDP-N-acetylglucosamine 2-epimerase (non-hydrolysing)
MTNEAFSALLVAGARPNFMKIAPIWRELEVRGAAAVLVHTGQHYDDALSEAFFRDLSIPPPRHHLGVGSGTHAVQTARVMEAFEPVLRSEAPDWVIVVGDVNSTLAASLVASKLKEELSCRVAHVEAGLRSHDWRMPEEVNRVLTDRLSDALLTPTLEAADNLLAEGIPRERIFFVGNIMIDTLLDRLPAARESSVLADLDLNARGYAVATLHRPSNVDRRRDLRVSLACLAAIAEAVCPVVLPLHPRTRAAVHRHGLRAALEPLTVIEPVGYLDMLALMDQSLGVLTDSGGIQEETTVLGIPCITLRENTERPITVSEGTNRLAPWPLEPTGLLRSFRESIAGTDRTGRHPEGWDGKAARRIVDALSQILEDGRRA